jgi:hypothetical protein
VGCLRVVARREAIRLVAHDRRRVALDPHHAGPCATAAPDRGGEEAEAWFPRAMRGKAQKPQPPAASAHAGAACSPTRR